MNASAAPAPSETKRIHILDAARRLLVQKGYRDILMDDVARSADVAKGTLYLYFKNKDELFAAAFEDLVGRLGEALEGVLASEAEGMELFLEMVRAILTHTEKYRDFFSQFSPGAIPASGPRAKERIFERFRENTGRVMQVLERCGPEVIPSGRVDRFAAHALFGLCRSLTVAQSVKGARAPLQASTEQIAEFFLHGARGKP